MLVNEGVPEWNRWRFENRKMVNLENAELSGFDLTEIDLGISNLKHARLLGADLTRAYLANSNAEGIQLRGACLTWATLYDSSLEGADLRDATLLGANLGNSDLRGADLRGANLSESNLSEADLSEANLQGACLKEANLTRANLSDTDLSGIDLTGATLLETNLSRSNLTGCRVYGISVWNANLHDTVQKDLVITPDEQPVIQVDRLEIAQFIYLLLNNAEIRSVIDSVTSKVVLILGRFSTERKVILDALRTALRDRNYVPILFDWDKPSSRTLTETISTLAHIAKFIIADITDAKSIPQELMAIVPHLPSVPIQPLLLASEREYGMFEHFLHYRSVLPIAFYANQHELLTTLVHTVIAPAEDKLAELRRTFGANHD